ncbi:MAG: hypothetical protein HYV52_00535 [Parcubacteria group bacterium]|nr:hypothetical protein [Parcubacteria group bacterium]
MILFQPIILASEFAQHAIMIVLFGVVLAEYISLFKRHQSLNVAAEKSVISLMPPAEIKNALLQKKRTTLLLLVAVFIEALWIIAEFFVDLDNFAYHVLFRWPIIVSVLIIFWRLTRNLLSGIKYIFMAFAVVTLAHIALDMYYFLYAPPWDRIAHSILKTAEATLLYFFVARFFIYTDNEPR